MDDLLSEFLTETAESLDIVDVELVRFETNPNDKDVLDKVFRLVHTVKGTCGFLDLPRLERVAHAAETMLGRFRDGELEVTPEGVSLILESLDHIKSLLAHLETEEKEPDGSDDELVGRLERAAAGQPIEADLRLLDKDAPAGDTAPVGAAVAQAALEEKLAAARQGADAPVAEEAAEAPAETDSAESGGVDTSDAAPAQQADDPAPEKPAAAQAVPQKEPETAGQVQPAHADSQIANQSIRVNVDVLENLMTMVSELVLTRNQLLEMVRHLDDSEFKVPLQRLSNVTAELQESVMKTRMQPIGNAWQKLPRIVRDLSHELKKKIQLDMRGADTELDRQVLELIKDPLTHMVRNSGDHGIETPEERRAAGKPEHGTIRLNAFHQGGHIIIEVGDDGRGLDIEKIKAKAVARGLVSEGQADGLSEAQIQKFIFHPGFSTASAVTNVSGRGVGMDVVRSNIELIGGSIDLRSTQGQGMVFTIKIPLTLAIVSALIVEAGAQRFAIPQLNVMELVRVAAGSDNKIEHINNTPVLRLRDRLLPLVFLENELKLGGKAGRADLEEAFIIVTQVGASSFGVVVDSVFDTEEIVVKPVASVLRDITMFSGNTILGDGSVIMIIDPNGLAASVGSSDQSDAELAEAMDTAAADDGATSLLIFRAGSEEPKAVPLGLVTRLEEIEVSRIEPSNGRNLVQYRGRLMPIVHVHPGTPLRESGRQPVLVFSDDRYAMGLAVDEIVDIVHEQLNVEMGADTMGMLGSAVVKGHVTEVLDVNHYLVQAFADWFDDGEEHIAGRHRVLLVDDSNFYRNMLAPFLSAKGYRVTAVESAERALSLRSQGTKFDLVLSDLHMPEMDGFAFAEAVRSDGAWAKLPLFALSSGTAPDLDERARAAGYDAFLPKVDRDGLVAAIRDVFQSVRKAA